MHSLYKNDTKTRVFSCSMGMFEVRGTQSGELDAATMDCVVGKARQPDSEPPHIAPARGPPLWEDCDAQVGEGAALEVRCEP